MAVRRCTTGECVRRRCWVGPGWRVRGCEGRALEEAWVVGAGRPRGAQFEGRPIQFSTPGPKGVIGNLGGACSEAAQLSDLLAILSAMPWRMSAFDVNASAIE